MKQMIRKWEAAASLVFIGAMLPAISMAAPGQMQLFGAINEVPTNPPVVGADGLFYGGAAFEIYRLGPGDQLSEVSSKFAEVVCYNGPDPECISQDMEVNPLVQGKTDQNFYGTTVYGGPMYGNDISYSFGTVFQQTPTGLTTFIHNFSGTDGQAPMGALVQGGTNGNGAYFGTTSSGDQYNNGNLFRVSADGSSFQVMHSFTALDTSEQDHLGRNSDGAAPQAGLVVASNTDFYGTTSKGGTNGVGTVFMLTPQGVFTTLHSFKPTTDGGNPLAALVLAGDGNFYGTTTTGGAHGYGTIFRITPTGTLTTLHSFDYTDGMTPESQLVEVDNGTTQNLYGTTAAGGANNNGVLYSITTTGKPFAKLYDFSAADDIGVDPSGLTVGEDGNLYGPGSADYIFEWILQPPVVTLKTSGKTETPTYSVKLTWSSTSATSCAATGTGAWSGSQLTSGSVTVTQQYAGTYTYTLTCNGPFGTAHKTATVTF